MVRATAASRPLALVSAHARPLCLAHARARAGTWGTTTTRACRARGFESFYGFYSGGIDYVTKTSMEVYDWDGDCHNGTETCYYDFWHNGEPQRDVIGWNTTHQTELLNAHAIDALAEHAAELDAPDASYRPLFLYLAYANDRLFYLSCRHL